MFLHFNRRPNEGSKWSTIYVQKSTLYLQFALQLNRRLRGRGAHFWSTIYLQSTAIIEDAIKKIYRAIGPRRFLRFSLFERSVISHSADSFRRRAAVPCKHPLGNRLERSCCIRLTNHTANHVAGFGEAGSRVVCYPDTFLSCVRTWTSDSIRSSRPACNSRFIFA